jgi:hypothetical protein
MAPWVKTGTSIKTGLKVIRYESFRNQNAIESRREAIPHANGSGVWYHTSYFLIRPDGTEKEYYTLKDAKKAAEEEGKE